MTKRYSASEIVAMNLAGLPKTKPGLLARAEKEMWEYETKVGLGGIRKMFVIPSAYLSNEGAVAGDAVAQVETSTKLPDQRDAQPAKVVGTVVAGSSQGDMDRIQLVIRAVSEWETERGVKISEERRPAVIAVLYDYVKKAEEAGEGDAGIERFLKALG